MGIVADPVCVYRAPISRGIFMQESLTTQNAGSDERAQFIPIRKSDITTALTKSGLLLGSEQHEKFRQLCRLLGAIFHYEYFEWLERLRDCAGRSRRCGGST
jgi:hypothetical protein